MPTDDDWAPLAPTAALGHPGEQAALVPSRPASARPQEAASAAAATAAWAALQQRLAGAKAPQSLLAAARQRDCVAAQVARAALAKAVGGSPPIAAAPAPASPAPEVASHAGDPRELEPWFRGLPAEQQQRLRAQWDRKREQIEHLPDWQRRLQWQRFTAAVVLFGSLLVLGTGAVKLATMGAGIVCGICWRHLSADRFRDPLVAVALLFAGHLIAMVGSGADRLPPGLFLDVLLLTGMAALVGFAGEIRRSGGFDVS
jgi:hypothetical protein